MMLWDWLVQIHCGLAFATSCCCGIEFMATMASLRFARFGSERVSFTSSSGYVDGNGYDSKKMAPITSGLRTNVRASGNCCWSCASSGGIFDTYSVLQGIDKVIP
jgi:NADH-quinone oxidoreductase subunit B